MDLPDNAIHIHILDCCFMKKMMEPGKNKYKDILVFSMTKANDLRNQEYKLQFYTSLNMMSIVMSHSQ